MKFSCLPSKTSAGPDGIPACFYKRLAVVLAEPLAKIFRVSFITCKIPDIWLQSIVIPIFKGKNSNAQASNYRPISLLCEALKIYERVVPKFMVSMFIDSIIPVEQHGFRKNYSTTTQLLSSYIPVYDAINRKVNYTGNIILLDIKKAFDSVSHKKLIIKLRALQLPSHFCDWFQAYLQARSINQSIFY